MKILILSDMEGITGVTHWRHVEPNNPDYQRGRKLMTGDLNAAIAGARAAGADEIYVTDGHEDGTNILIEELVGVTGFNSGHASELSNLQGVQESPDAVICIGYHARMGTQNAICDHTFSGHIYDLNLNQRLCGEFGMAASVCGFFDIPILFVSGDQAVCAEAKEWVDGVESVAVKQANGRFSAVCLPPEKTHLLIASGVEKAVRDFAVGKGTKPLKTSQPVKISVDFRNTSLADSAARLEGCVRTNGRRIDLSEENILKAFIKFRELLNLAGD